MLYAVARRTREFGIRVAIGARAGSIVRLVLGEAVWLVATGWPGPRVGVGARTSRQQPAVRDPTDRSRQYDDRRRRADASRARRCGHSRTPRVTC